MKKIITITLMTTTMMVIWICAAFSQKKPLDTANFGKWPELAAPYISPDGNYFFSTIVNYPTGYNSATIKSVKENWSKSFVYRKPDFVNFEMINTHAVFVLGEDTLNIVKLGGSVEKITGYSSFKLNQSGNFAVVAQNGENLLLITQDKRESYPGVLEYHFVLNGSKLLVKTKELIYLVSLTDFSKTEVWKSSNVGNLLLDNGGQKIAFLCSGKSKFDNRLICIALDKGKSFEVSAEKYPGLFLSEAIAFNDHSGCIIVRLQDTTEVTYRKSGIDLTVWNYKDEVLQDEQIERLRPASFFGSISLSKHSLLKLENAKEDWDLVQPPAKWGRKKLVIQTVGNCSGRERFWSMGCERRYSVVDILTGVRTQIKSLEGLNRLNDYKLSPDGNFIVFFDFQSDTYKFCEVRSDKVYELTGGKSKQQFYNDTSHTTFPRGIAGWGDHDNKVYLYDYQDIWRFDLTGKDDPVDITLGYGKENKMVFSFLMDQPEIIDDRKNEYILAVLDMKTKDNGFFALSLKNKTLSKRAMGAYLYVLPKGQNAANDGMQPLKATSRDIFVVKRQRSDAFPNYFITSDFRDMKQMTDFSPESSYKWIQTKLVSWVLPDGKVAKGVLYIPKDLDSTKKYPVIFNIYEQLSNSLHAYEPPGYLCQGCAINPPLAVSKGYLVFKPDIFYKVNEAGSSALTSLEGAVKALGKIHWIDTARLGLQGCSWGGYQANYIATRSQLFKAICSSSGVTDIPGFGTTFYKSVYSSFSYGQLRLTKQLWETPDVYVKSSPIFNADKIATPLLLFITSEDFAVPPVQGHELYRILRKLNMPCWMLEYGGSASHGVFDLDQQMDFSKRMFQFFDVYLKDTKAPKWMAEGIEAKDADKEKGLQLTN